jgi:hypothetical protein
MPTTLERTQTAAEARKQKAEASLKQLKTEREQIQSRQQTAAKKVEELNRDIAVAGRSGEADRLAELRDDRRAAEEDVRDLQRALPAVDEDIRLGEGELHMAERACCAEQYNAIQTKQAELLKTITEAVELIATSMDQKAELAVRQDRILSSICPRQDLDAGRIRYELAHAIMGRLQGGPATPLRGLDWSSWPVTDQLALLR